MNRMEANLVWFKRDFRVHDHAPLEAALAQDQPLVLLALFEPGLQQLPDFHMRHHRFAYQSALDLENALGAGIPWFHFFQKEAVAAFQWLLRRYQFRGVYSHMEVGNRWTYERDKRVGRFLRSAGIPWREYSYNGILRGAKNRVGWNRQWTEWVERPPLEASLDPSRIIPAPEEVRQPFDRWVRASGLDHRPGEEQPGGRSYALRYLRSFVDHRHRDYLSGLAKPAASRRACSRLSPYLAWGCLSHREVWHQGRPEPGSSVDTEALRQFRHRLRWHDHLIQKFESQPDLEIRNQNPAYDALRRIWKEDHYQAWQQGRTGYPLVDACMRCVCATGYLNFRMRAMLVSFLTHLLWLDWRRGARFLAGQFLDYEPGIHYPQFQMQAGTVGIHTVRVYNPVRQAQRYDPAALFIKQWVPELRPLPVAYALEPWRLSFVEQKDSGFELGRCYPYPIVPLKRAHRNAREQLWNTLRSEEAQQAALAILDRHVEDPEERKAALQQGQPA